MTPGYDGRPEGGDNCPCSPCQHRRWIIRWAAGNTERTPPLEILRWYVRHLKR